MIIGCPECETKFGIPEGTLGDQGRKVRCAKCSHVWYASSADAIEVPTATVSAETANNPSENLTSYIPEGPQKTPQPIEEAVVEEVAATPADEVSEEGVELGDSSVEEALAVIKGTAIEEPDFPLSKGEIGEFDSEPNNKKIIIGWAALGAFILIILLSFVFMQETLRQAWPPITKLYDVVGLIENPRPEQDETGEPEAQEDMSKYIRISNDASVERLADGTPALVIRGSVTNSADFDIDLPSAAVVLRNEMKQDILVWPFDFDETTIKAGKTMPFVEAIKTPPQETTEFELMLLWNDQ